MPVDAAAAAARWPTRRPSFPERVAELERRGLTRDEAICHTLLERGALLEGA